MQILGLIHRDAYVGKDSTDGTVEAFCAASSPDEVAD